MKGILATVPLIVIAVMFVHCILRLLLSAFSVAYKSPKTKKPGIEADKQVFGNY